MFGRFGSRPYIQNTNAIVAVISRMPAPAAIASHLATVTQVRRGDGDAAWRFNSACTLGRFCNLDTRYNWLTAGSIPHPRLVCHIASCHGIHTH